MLSLFSTSSDTAGYRLQYMEIFNWGTFHEKIYRINPQGNNSLLTGANASGKSTLIDALLTLIVPAKKDRFYNQSSGVEKKGDRTEETYVLGNYGNIQQDGAASTATQRLREKNIYSVILASFYNSDQRIVTLFQVRWFTNGELKRSFGLSREPLEIQNDFVNFDGKGGWKKLLEKKYNGNTTKKRIEFFNGPIEYGERIYNLFGMRSEKGLTLFNQIVGVKVLDDLDEFIRTNMLEEKDSENEYLQLNDSFSTLMEAKINIEKTKEQIFKLQPIDKIANELFDIQNELYYLQQSKEIAVYWFAKKNVELSEIEITKLNSRLDILKEELHELREKEDELKKDERQLSISIETDEVSSKIKDLTKEITRLEKSKENRSQKLDKYNEVAREIKLPENPTEEIFVKNREISQNKKNELETVVEGKNEELRHAKNNADNIETQINDNIRIIDSLKKSQNNISGRVAEIREMILQATGATPDEIPFIGELIQVKDSEREWELSIEKILHNFALRLIVPEKYYVKVNEFVNSNNLKGRIVYQRYNGFTSLKELTYREIASNDLLQKIEFKPKNNYTEWLEDMIF